MHCTVPSIIYYYGERERVHMYNRKERKNKTREPQGSLRLLSLTVSLTVLVMFSSFFGGERKRSHFPKLKSEKVKILTSPSIFADVGTKITVMENILHGFSLDKTEPELTKFYLPQTTTRRQRYCVATCRGDYPGAVRQTSLLL